MERIAVALLGTRREVEPGSDARNICRHLLRGIGRLGSIAMVCVLPGFLYAQSPMLKRFTPPEEIAVGRTTVLRVPADTTTEGIQGWIDRAIRQCSPAHTVRLENNSVRNWPGGPERAVSKSGEPGKRPHGEENIASAQAREDRWLERSGFGLMFHYEAFKNHSAESYNEAVDSFDVKRFADSVAATRAGHVIFVIGQHWGRYCAPNSAYEKRLGVGPGVWTSKRDLIMEIGRELEARDVRLILYMTARAPMRHYKIIKAMDDTLPTINGKPAGPEVNPMSHPRKVKGFRRSENQAPTAAFLKAWGEVCGEWSRRYGRLVSGWWFDGYKLEMQNAYESLQAEQHNIDTWVAAVRSGNPDTELAFNAGAHPILSLCTNGRLCPHQTFTAGENHDFHSKTKKGKGPALTPKNFPAPDGVVWHLLLPVSDGWGAGTESRFALETLKKHVDTINAEGGVVTFDVPIAADGTVPEAILELLRRFGSEAACRAVETRRKGEGSR